MLLSGCRTCDQQVTGLTSGRSLSSNNRGQVVLTIPVHGPELLFGSAR